MSDKAFTTSELWARKHSYRRVDRPRWPFVVRGMLPVLGLLLVALFAMTRFANHWVEEQVNDHVSDALRVSGHDWVNIRTSGQRVTLSGGQPSLASGDEAIRVASVTTCPTWLGPKVCATSVAGRFSGGTDIPVGPVGLSAPDLTSAAECDAAFSAALAVQNIEFAFGSAVIVATTAPLLDRITALVLDCPGPVRIEGHTDSTGDAQVNQALSAARAEAVRGALMARGIEPDRIMAEGFGATRPIAGNDTANGRARNRRIEFRAISGTN